MSIFYCPLSRIETKNKHFCRFYTCIQNQIIHKHVHVNYNQLKGMHVLISSLTLSTVPYAAGPESRGHSRTTWLYRCQTASQVSLFIGSLISWISLLPKTTTIGTPRIKVILQYVTKKYTIEYVSTSKSKSTLWKINVNIFSLFSDIVYYLSNLYER